MQKINKIILSEIKKNINVNFFVDFLNEKYAKNGVIFTNENNTIIIYNYKKLEKHELSKFEGIIEGINYCDTPESRNKTG